jgi:hypothetical protein
LLLDHCTDPLGNRSGRSFVKNVRGTSWVQSGSGIEDSIPIWKALAPMMVLWSSGCVCRDSLSLLRCNTGFVYATNDARLVGSIAESWSNFGLVVSDSEGTAH